MTTTLTLEELEQGGERDLGATDWVTLDQERINGFAEATGDHQWIHVDPDKAAQGPFGGTIAHGYLSLSLLPGLMPDVLRVEGARMGINYGIDRIRFTAPVPVNSQVRVKARLLSAERRGEGVLYKLGVEVEVKDAEKPALVGEVLYLVFAG
jgi:acyl dehydratase